MTHAITIRLATFAFILLILLSTGCGSQIRQEATPSLTLIPLRYATGTTVITSTPPATFTPAPPPAQPTAVLVEGVTSTQINVRAEPSTASKILGMIPANTKVEITGTDPGEKWWQINYPQGQGVDGKGWVTAQYITTASTPEVPTIGENPLDPNGQNVAIVQQQLNVRSGPGTDFNSLGTLNPQDVVSLIGKDSQGTWLQIDFEGGPEGKGWVNAAFVQAKGVEKLPILTEAGMIVGTGTPTGIPPSPTVTVVPAWEDNDSPKNPVASMIFEPTGTQTLIYNGDLSTPQGDSEDWIGFQPYGPAVFISLECQGNGSLRVNMTEDTLPLSLEIACGTPMKEIPVKAGSNYAIHVQAVPMTAELQYINYILTIRARL